MRRRILPLAGIASGGIVLGHVLGYAMAFPDVRARQAHLVSTGHESFCLLVAAAGVAATLALSVIAIRAARARGLPSRRLTAVSLAVLQLAGFALLELSERRFSVASIANDPAVLVGLAVQVAVAIGLAIVLRLFVRAVETVAARLRRRRAPAVGLPRPSYARIAGPRARLLAARLRAPPVPLAP